MTNFEKLKLDTPEELVDFLYDHMGIMIRASREEYVAWLKSNISREEWLEKWKESLKESEAEE